MGEQFIFNFKTEISSIFITSKLNNPSNTKIPNIIKMDADQFKNI